MQFADVFEGFEPKKYNKLKMIATSVAGSMHKMKTNFTEPIINFVRKIRGAWDYAKNTNISDIGAVRTISDVMSRPIEIPGVNALRTSVDNIKNKLSAKMGFLNEDIFDLGKEISAKWEAIVSKIQPERITSDMSVSELEALWKAEIAAVTVGGAV